MTLRDISLILLSWIGAVVISFAVYEWRQDNDLDDLRDRVDELQDELGIGDDEIVGFEPETATSGDLVLAIVSSTDDDDSIPGIIEGKGSLILRMTNNGDAFVEFIDLQPSATARDGSRCETLLDHAESTGGAGPGQFDEVRLVWDCENLGVLNIGGVDFTPVD